MIRRPPRSTRPSTPFPDPPRFRAPRVLNTPATLPVGGKAAKTIIAFERIAAVAHETEQAGKDSGVDPAIGRRGANLGEQFILAKRRGAGERPHMLREQTGRASCRGRVCQSV